MARRRQNQPFRQEDQTATPQSSMGTATLYGAQQQVENAVEPTHNNNFAWNGQPIPSYSANRTTGGAQTQGANVSQNAHTGPNAYSTQNQTGQSQGTHTHSNWQYPSNQVQHQQAYGQTYTPSGAQQSSQTVQQSVSYGGSYGQSSLPAAGSTGNLNAAYGDRNTGINHADARNVGFQGGYTGYGANGQPLQYGTFMRDGTQYGKGPHTIDPSKKIINAVRYGDGGITAVRFQDGTTADIAQAIGMAEAGLIEDVNTGVNREGQKTLRSYPDGDPSNNLSNLPRF